MIRVEGQRIIRASVHRVFQLVSRLDAHPSVTGLWMTADLLDRRGNELTVQYRGYLAGIPIESVQQAILQPPSRVEFRQTRGGLKTFRGSYVLNPLDGDTELLLTVDADVGIPLISEAAAHRVLHAYVEQSLDKFKLAAERELPRPLRRSPSPAVTQTAAPPPPEPLPAPSSPPTAVAGGSEPEQVRKRRRRRRRRRRRSPNGPKEGPGPANPLPPET